MAVVKRIAKGLCPPILWRLARTFAQREKPLVNIPALTKIRTATTLAALDAEIAAADEANRISDDALRAALASFRFSVPVDLPDDPFSDAYRQAQFDLYKLVSGRADYSPDDCEMTDFDLDALVQRPFPYSTHSSTTLGEQLMAIGFLTRALQLQPGDRILEFGPGWGKTTTEFAQLGYAVTAVDICQRFLDLIQRRCEMLGLDVETARADMLNYEPSHRFERVVFYECFHHCSDHLRMIRRLDELVTPGGQVVFAGEPIVDDFPCPWGLRLDGISAWSIRKFGWLELGFCTDYFLDVMARHGWAVQRLPSADVPWQTVFVAKRMSKARP